MDVQQDSEAASAIAPRGSQHAIPGKTYGWLSRLRSYFILDPLIWFYTFDSGIACSARRTVRPQWTTPALVFANLVVADHENDLVAGEGHRPG